MDSVILFGLRIGLLVVLWLFILFALNSMRKDVKIAASSPNRGAGSGGSASSVPPAAHHGGMPQQMTIVDGPMTGSRMDFRRSHRNNHRPRPRLRFLGVR